jgi:hypothetical protein
MSLSLLGFCKLLAGRASKRGHPQGLKPTLISRLDAGLKAGSSTGTG